MKRGFKLFLFFLCVSQIACNSEVIGIDISSNWQNETHSLEDLNSPKAFFLDSVTTFNSRIQIYKHFVNENETEDYYCLLNPYKNSIYFYSFDSEIPTFHIEFDKVGPDGVGSLKGVSGFRVVNLDSIFLYSYSRKDRFILTDTLAKVKEVFRFEDKLADEGSPVLSGGSPMIYKDGKVYFISYGRINGFKKNNSYPENLVQKYDLRDFSTSYSLAYPEIYTKGVWGYQAHELDYSYNSKLEKFIYSFPIDNHLYITEDHENYQSVEAGSQAINLIKPLSTGSSFPDPGSLEDYKFLIGQSHFGPVFTDPVSGFTLRVAFKKIPPEKLKKIGMNTPSDPSNFSFIILNQNLKKVGEVDFSGKDYNVYNAFFHGGIFHLMERNLDDEDHVIYSRFKIVEI